MRTRNAHSLEELLFWYVYDHPLSLRSAMCQRFGVSRATLCRAVAVLLERGLVVEVPARNGTRGRHPHSLHPNPELAALLGLDVQVDGVTAVVTDMMGRLLGRSSARCDARDGAAEMLSACRSAARVALTDARIPARGIRHLGIGFSGEIDPATGTCLSWLSAPGWKGVPLGSLFRESFKLDVTIGDRACAVALGQRRTSGEDWKHPDALYVIASDGIGLGIFVDGRLYRGAGQVAGEFGHTVIDSQGPLCRCGRSGCIEATAGVLSIIRSMQDALQAGQQDSRNSPPRGLTIEAVAAAAHSGDPLALAVIRRAAMALGTGIVNAVHLLNPSLIVLCGKLARVAGPEILDAVKQTFDAECIAAVSKSVEIRLARAKKDVAAIGCALLGAEAEAERALRARLAAKKP